MKRVLINGRWPLNLPDHRADRPEWCYWEATRLAAMHHFIEPGDVIYDIGAEAGDFAALFATWGARPVLIEPNPKAWPTIKAVWEANLLYLPPWFMGLCGDGYAQPIVKAHDRMQRIGWDRWPKPADDPIDPGHGFYSLHEHSETAAVRTLDYVVDTLMEKVPDVDVSPTVITMDIEGGELKALKGATKTLTDIKPAVFASLHPQFMADLYGEDVSQIHDLMKSYGYHGRFLCEDHEQHWYWGHPDSGRMLPGAAADYYIPGDRVIL